MDHINIKNNLLRSLSYVEFERIAGHLESISLPKNFVISSIDRVSDYTYFLDSGLGSIVMETASGERGAVGIFGWEGMAPTFTMLGDATAPFAISMQMAGSGVRIANLQLAAAADNSILLRRILSRYLQTMLVQASSWSLANAAFNIHRRLARWILMCHDRMEGNEVPFTHEAMAIMLGIRRQSVTTSLHHLESEQLITASRASVSIRNRKALEASAGEAYGAPEREYDKLLGAILRK